MLSARSTCALFDFGYQLGRFFMQKLPSFFSEKSRKRPMYAHILIQRFIQAILVSVRRHKKLNPLIEFSNSIFTNFVFKHVGIELAFKIN